jgi:uncharacterized membrane protein
VALATFATDSGFAISLGINAFFLVYLALTVAGAGKLTADFLRAHAAEEDEPAPFILVVTLAAVAVSALSLFLAMRAEALMSVQLALAAASVLLGWFASHTMWAMHYAYEYYGAPTVDGGKRGKPRGGLDFPGGEAPNGVAFVYFAYVVGMTAQTADIGLTSNAMRRLVLFHSVFAFFFNTVIVAAAVTIAVAFAR